MILEGLVTTVSPQGALNIAPMGPKIEPGSNLERFELRPYRTSNTYRNLKARGEGVFHITDDVLVLAQAAIGAAFDPEPQVRPASRVAGWILEGACRYHEFRVIELDDREDRSRILVETAAAGRLRDFLGFNRARHAVVEAAILATRTAFLSRDTILAEFHTLATIVAKTGGPVEAQAFDLLHRFVRESAGSSTPPSSPTGS